MATKVGFLLLVLLAGLAASVSPSAAAEIEAAPRVYVIADPNAAHTQVWMIVGAGCRDEPGHCHGLAHYLEHLVFLGREEDRGAAAAALSLGSEGNANTTSTRTLYWRQFPRRAEGSESDVEKQLQIYAQEIAELKVPPEEAARERNIVLREYDWRFATFVERRFGDALQRALYPGHPFGEDTLGTRDDISALSVNEARAFHDAWYVRDNVSFVVYGAVDPAAVGALAQKYLSALPRSRAAARRTAAGSTRASISRRMREASTKSTPRRFSAISR